MTLFLTNSIILKILGGHVPPPHPLFRGPFVHSFKINFALQTVSSVKLVTLPSL